MQEQFKEYGLNFVQIVILFVLLIMPKMAGLTIIDQYNLTEIHHYMNIYMGMAGMVLIYFVTLGFYNERIIGRLHDLIYLKFLIIILIFFWIVYDGYFAYIYQKVYSLNEAKIFRRDVVWSDVSFQDLPANVIYPDFKAAFLGALSLVRFCFLSVIVYLLMNERPIVETNNKLAKRRKKVKKSMDEIKANLHPSVLKSYENSDKSE